MTTGSSVHDAGDAGKAIRTTWFEMSDAFIENIAFKRAGRLLGIDRYALSGHVARLTSKLLTRCADGNVSGIDADTIADLAGWPGDPEEFVGALTEGGVIGPHGVLATWADTGGPTTENGNGSL
jgi:hypothetical protein